jgi:hypothetical protein
MFRIFTSGLIAALLSALAPAANPPEQEEVQNPEFRSWANYPKGTTVTTKTTSVSSFRGTDTTLVRVVVNELIEVGKNKLVLESRVTLTDSVGKTYEEEKSKMEVQKYFPLPRGTKKDDFGKWGFAKDVMAPGEPRVEGGTVKVPAGEYKAQAYTWSKKDRDGRDEVSYKVWLSECVPGLIVKKTSSSFIFESSNNSATEVIEVKKPKQ